MEQSWQSSAYKGKTCLTLRYAHFLAHGLHLCLLNFTSLNKVPISCVCKCLGLCCVQQAWRANVYFCILSSTILTEIQPQLAAPIVYFPCGFQFRNYLSGHKETRWGTISCLGKTRHNADASCFGPPSFQFSFKRPNCQLLQILALALAQNHTSYVIPHF